MEWETIIENVKNLLTDGLIEFKFDGHGEFKIPHTEFRSSCTIEVTGTPWRPEYWVGEMKCKFSELLECIKDYEVSTRWS